MDCMTRLQSTDVNVVVFIRILLVKNQYRKNTFGSILPPSQEYRVSWFVLNANGKEFVLNLPTKIGRLIVPNRLPIFRRQAGSAIELDAAAYIPAHQRS
jgi:hypothetical protein